MMLSLLASGLISQEILCGLVAQLGVYLYPEGMDMSIHLSIV